jgi:ribonuclease T1
MRPAHGGGKRRSKMRAVAVLGWLVLVLWGGEAPAVAQRSAEPQNLGAFAQRIGLRDVEGFVDTVQSVRRTQRLPSRYVTKDAARARGWRGGGLCDVWPGQVIGGDTMRNFGGKLPDMPGRVFREADLDGDCRSRGPRRLVFSNDGLIYVTLDHYNSFMPVP